MLTIQQKVALISQIRDILIDDSLTDDVKAQLITECLPSDLSRGVIIDLIETDGENASTESLLRQAITKRNLWRAPDQTVKYYLLPQWQSHS